MTNSVPLLTIERVSKRYPGVVALDDVSLEIVPGEIHAIVGENGAGKSTLMKILSGVVVDYEGSLRLRGQTVKFRGTRDAEDAGISIIHQELNLVEPLSVAANLFLGREPRTALGFLDERLMRKRAGELLADLECKVAPTARVGTLRVGDQQLVEIAKALSRKSDLLILDEPTSALTEAESTRLFRIMRRLREQGVTLLYISHKMDEVFALADRLTVLRDGRQQATLLKTETNRQDITRAMVGREIQAVPWDEPRTPREVVLEVAELSLPWPGHARQWRLHNVSFQLRAGEILGVAGLMGAGRTELLECLFGASAERPSGTLRVAGRVERFAHPADAVRAGLALVTEDRKRLGIFSQFSVGENISLCRLDEALSNGLLSRSREAELAQTMVARLSVKTSGLGARITSLSGGNQQKCILGRWLLTKPKVLLLDDPTRGVDVGAKAELYRLLDRLAREGLGMIVTSSELPELLTVCDRILVLCEGRLTGTFSRAEATEERIMEAATRVTS